jgi:hypothetical protein
MIKNGHLGGSHFDPWQNSESKFKESDVSQWTQARQPPSKGAPHK